MSLHFVATTVPVDDLAPLYQVINSNCAGCKDIFHKASLDINDFEFVFADQAPFVKIAGMT